MDLQTALSTLIRELSGKNNLSLPNAVACAKNMDRALAEYGDEGRRVQCNYILCNLGAWRGPVAREVKETLKQYAKS